MGALNYGSNLTIEIDDRPLAHLQIVISAKLRRQEPFSFTYVRDHNHGTGRVSIWLSPAVPISFDFFGSKKPALNPAWIEALNKTASSPSGLSIVPEPPKPE